MTDSELQQKSDPTEAGDEKEDESFANNYATAIALGLPFGMAIGLLILDDITWGVILGLGFAPIIAMVMTRMNTEK